jgi:energy-coupling factor transporter transmembrane protein EcfT
VPAWLEYGAKNTVIHRLHPLTKVVMLGVMLVLVGLYFDIRYLLVIGAVALVLNRIAKVPGAWFKPLGAIFIALIPFTLIGIFGQVNPSLFKVYPRSLVSITFFVLNLGPLGSYGFTVGGLLWGLATELRVPIILLITYTFIFSTSLSDLVQGMAKGRLPNALVFTVMVAYRFVPSMWRYFNQIMIALRLRGWELASRNPRVIFSRAYPLMGSLARQTLATTDEVTVAAKIRGFGPRKISPTRDLRIKFHDYAIMAVSIAIFAVAVYYLITQNAGLI